jgi:hypothetical protein
MVNTAKLPPGDKNSALCVLEGCRRLGSLHSLGTFDTILSGRRHRNDFNILRSMGNVSPTITVSHLRSWLFSCKEVAGGDGHVDSPRDHDDEVHDVPHVAQVAAAVQDQAHR